MTVDVSESQTQLSETNKLLTFWTELYYWFTNLPLFIFGRKWKYCLISWADILGMMNLNLKFWIFDRKLTTFKLFTNGQRFISLFITFCTFTTTFDVARPRMILVSPEYKSLLLGLSNEVDKLKLDVPKKFALVK